MAAGLGLVNLVLNYENQDFSTVLTLFLCDKGSYSRHCVAVNKESHSHCTMNLLLLQLEKYKLQSQNSFLGLMMSTYIRERWLLWGEAKLLLSKALAMTLTFSP